MVYLQRKGIKMNNCEFKEFCDQNHINITKNKILGYRRLNKLQRLHYILDRDERFRNLPDFPFFMFKNDLI